MGDVINATSTACRDCAHMVVAPNTLVCGIVGERCEQARNVWSGTSCGPEARCFVSKPKPADVVLPKSLRAECALVLRTIAFRIFSGRR